MHKGQAIMKKLILSAALMCITTPVYAQEVDPMHPWQRDRAAHQEKMLEDAKRYRERYPVYVKERYVVDGVGVIDKEGARAEYDKEHAPMSLGCDASDDDVSENDESTDADEAAKAVSAEGCAESETSDDIDESEE